MKYLEKSISGLLNSEGYILKGKTVEAVAEYIEGINERQTDVYTPRMWFEDTKRNYPRMLINKDSVVEKTMEYITDQNKECLDQTGELPDIDDYVMAFDSEEFKERVGYDLTVDEFIRLLIEYTYNHMC